MWGGVFGWFIPRQWIEMVCTIYKLLELLHSIVMILEVILLAYEMYIPRIFLLYTDIDNKFSSMQQWSINPNL